MNLKDKISPSIQQMVETIKKDQYTDGSWKYCFESGPMTDANMIIILRVLEYDEEYLIKKLVNRLLHQQQNNGAWKLYDDDEGNLSATVEAYTALLFSGYLNMEDTSMKKAEQFIIENEGLEKSHISTKFILALNQLYPWPKIFPISLGIMHLPQFLPFHFYKFSSYVRAHFAPILILGHEKFATFNKWTPNLTHLFASKKKGNTAKKSRGFFRFLKYLSPKVFVNSAKLKAEQYILKSIESDGTLYSYSSATFFMIYALLSLGYKKTSPFVQHAIQGLKSFVYQIDDDYHVQNSPSTVWDTALLTYALQESGLTIKDPSIQLAANYLLNLQHIRKGAFIHQHADCGWGFSESNSLNPDVDDTQAALRALSNFSLDDSKYRTAWNSGVIWLLSMQNKDGGWGAFEKNSNSSVKWIFPIQNFKDTAIDPSAADLTGRTLEFLGSHLKLTVHHPRVKKGVDWLIKNQTKSGSWYGRWGISHIYGTWAAVTGLRAVGVPADHPSIQKAVKWLLAIKQPDGGWGESCQSDIYREYISLPYSTLVQTSWAVDALISTSEIPTKEIDEGISKILDWTNDKTNRITYPTGAGLPGHFYIYYHSYQYIWPLITLSHYTKKYE